MYMYIIKINNYVKTVRMNSGGWLWEVGMAIERSSVIAEML